MLINYGVVDINLPETFASVHALRPPTILTPACDNKHALEILR